MESMSSPVIVIPASLEKHVRYVSSEPSETDNTSIGKMVIYDEDTGATEL